MNATPKPTAGVSWPQALAARWYTDPAVFEKEIEQIFGRTWQFAFHANCLRKPGDFRTFRVGRANLFGVLDRSGHVRCYHNICRHRAHQLLEASGNRQMITCPYHGWCYGLDGALRSAPGTGDLDDFPDKEIRLREVRSENFCGFVFVNLCDDTRTMDDWYPAARQELSAFLPQIESFSLVKEYEVNEACNWKISVENYNECYHCKLRHPTFSSGVIDPERYEIGIQGRCLRHSTEPAKTSRSSNGEPVSEYRSWFLWPTFSFQVYPGGVLNSYSWSATSNRSVTVRRGWYALDGANCEEHFRLAKQDVETTVAEDVALVESVQRGLDSGFYEPGPLVVRPDGGVLSEHSIVALNNWVREAVGHP